MSASQATNTIRITHRWGGLVLFECEATAEFAGLSAFARIGRAVLKALAGGADLRGAYLGGADLRGADLRDANLRPIRADLYDVLVNARDEAPAFLAALRAGKVNGSAYQGECACLVGTIAKVRGVNYTSLEYDSTRPIERFVLNIEQGDTPETSQVAALVAEWTERFIGVPASAQGPV